MDKVTGHGNQVWLELNEQAQSQIACRSCEAMRNEAMDAGCIAYLRKPFAQDALLNAISKAVAWPAQP
jgi:FixJ family two-component response regulator